MDSQKHYNNSYCNNCGKDGHVFGQCKMPITSFGIILFRMNEQGVPEYLMIRRKDTLGFIDFMRGKYSTQKKYYIMNMLKQMTIQEKKNLREKTFDQLWNHLWLQNENTHNTYKTEELVSKEKFESLKKGIHNGNEFFSLATMIDESIGNHELWSEPEWGFPKGRRDYREKDYECALREFSEETGYETSKIKNFQNVFPFEEIFMGSNYKSYKHKYYLASMDYNDSLNYRGNYQTSEVSELKWKPIEDCLLSIRSYNLEKKKLLSCIHKCLTKYRFSAFV